jgi:hypothetical protein
MAELAIKIGNQLADVPALDGFIVSAYNNRRVRFHNAQAICNPVLFGFTPDGLRENDTVAHVWMEQTHQYRFERTGSTVRRVHLRDPGTEDFWTLSEEALGYRLENPRHKVFGAAGAEVWYGGHVSWPDASLDAIWAAIETKTAHREVDHRRLFLSDITLRQMLWVSVDDFDDATRAAYHRPVYDPAKALKYDKTTDTTSEVSISGLDDPKIGEERLTLIMLRKCAFKIVWRNLPGLSAGTQDDIADKDTAVDIRAAVTFVRDSVVSPTSVAVIS